MIRFHGLRPFYPMVCMHIWASIGMRLDARAYVGIWDLQALPKGFFLVVLLIGLLRVKHRIKTGLPGSTEPFFRGVHMYVHTGTQTAECQACAE